MAGMALARLHGPCAHRQLAFVLTLAWFQTLTAKHLPSLETVGERRKVLPRLLYPHIKYEHRY